jgi:hypothetical protein
MKRGDTFTHAIVQERLADGSWRPARCTVTRVAQGLVYYKLEGERKAKSRFSVDDVYRFCRRDDGRPYGSPPAMPPTIATRSG